MADNANKYSVHVSMSQCESGEYGFSAIEIVPPIPKAFAARICRKVVEYCEKIPGMSDDKDQPETSLTSYGFCDEGALVSTIFQFGITPGFINDHVIDRFGHERQLQQFVESQLSSSGAAIETPER